MPFAILYKYINDKKRRREKRYILGDADRYKSTSHTHKQMATFRQSRDHIIRMQKRPCCQYAIHKYYIRRARKFNFDTLSL